jgi:hypothetical protein
MNGLAICINNLMLVGTIVGPAVPPPPPSVELREDGGDELREDGGDELREDGGLELRQ